MADLNITPNSAEKDVSTHSDKSTFYELLADPTFEALLIEEVKFRVRERMRQRRAIQNLVLGCAILLASLGLALSWDSHSKIEETRERDDRVAAALIRISTVINSASSARENLASAGRK